MADSIVGLVSRRTFDWFAASHVLCCLRTQALFNGGFDYRPSYSGRKAPSLKMQMVCFSFSFGGSTSSLMLIGSRPHDTSFVVSRTAVNGGLDCRHSLFPLE